MEIGEKENVVKKPKLYPALRYSHKKRSLPFSKTERADPKPVRKPSRYEKRCALLVRTGLKKTKGVAVL